MEKEICGACDSEGAITCVCCGGSGYADNDLDENKEPPPPTQAELEDAGQMRLA